MVAKGFAQSYDVDYQETFASIAKLNTIRVFLSLVVNSNWSPHQMDVKNVFLNGELEENFFIEIPIGLGESLDKDVVCRLKKAL